MYKESAINAHSLGREPQTAQHVEAIPGVSASALSPAVRVAQPCESGSLKVALGAAFFDDPVFGWAILGIARTGPMPLSSRVGRWMLERRALSP